mmetsp:Transcript_22923/g.54172  ORF Transcript_22923/g.54172 Transcript_22923/m.54172 type:complete len:264 (+) Transcript_22923:3-794(+)
MVLRVERSHSGQVVTATLNRPRRFNALNSELVRELHRLLDSLNDDFVARVLILVGAGPSFCAGADIKEAAGADGPPPDTQQYENQRKFSSLIVKMRRIPQIIIAGVQGSAAGGGMALALAADIRIAGKSSKFIPSFVHLGLSGAELGTSYFLPRLVGLSLATEFLVTAEPVNATRALETRLVSHVVFDEDILWRCTSLAENIVATTSRAGLVFTKQALNASVSATNLESQIDFEDRQQLYCLKDEECRDFGIQHITRVTKAKL